MSCSTTELKRQFAEDEQSTLAMQNPTSLKYYALIKIRGKQIKRSLKSDNLAHARHALRDVRCNQEGFDLTAGRPEESLS